MEFEKRRNERCAYSQIVSYSHVPSRDNKFVTGLLHDFSYSGLCLITRSPLQHGQDISVKCSLLSNAPTATVRWCSYAGNGKYRVGLEFKIQKADISAIGKPVDRLTYGRTLKML